MQDITIRNASLADAPRILEIYAWYVEHTVITFEYDVPSLEEFEGRMRRTMQKYPYLVIERDGRVEGYAYAGSFVGRAAYDWACELTIYLDHDARKHGMGRALYEALADRLKAMGMEEVAEEMGVHVSTVSRACRDKYLLCKWGMKELRAFFSAGVPAEGGAFPDGAGAEAVASGAVQELMRRLIAEEDSSRPLSDARLAAALQEKGVNIARRTVAKYREQMKILPASLRRGI